MDGTQLGKKLKEARLTKKMTQSDVVGTFITRNMLSQIESGAASPSLRTLEYLANKLELPVHYLISEERTVSLAPDECSACGDPIAALPQLPLFLKCKEAFVRGDCDYVIRQAAALDDPSSLCYDEGAALLARAYLKTAVTLMEAGEYKAAVPQARLAARYGEVGIYASREIRTDALLMLDEVSEKMA
jgi:transcriptional regulator with XRE-family HTH domain